MTLDRAIGLVDASDRPRIEANVARAFERRMRDVPDIEYRITWPDGMSRILVGRGRLTLDDAGDPVRMVGTVQDVTEQRELEREHRIAQTLQQALAPLDLPTIPGLELAARYLPAEEGSSAGGDWYDVLDLPNGSVGFVIGDVAGHGVDATSFMGQVRTSIRAYALEGLQPSAVVDKAHRFLRQLKGGNQMVTLLYITIDMDNLEMRVVDAGHPPPIVHAPGAPAHYLETRTALPLGIDFDIRPMETRSELEPGTRILLYTDGLVDRRNLPIEHGFAQLIDAVTRSAGTSVETLCDTAIDALVTSEVSDDVAVLAVEVSKVSAHFALSIDADPHAVASVRKSLARWLSSSEVERSQIDDVVLACSEACSNSVEHAYGLEGGSIEIDGELIDGEVVVSVRDSGGWRPARDLGRGRGLKLIDACMDGYVVDQDRTGTVVTMRRNVRTRPG